MCDSVSTNLRYLIRRSSLSRDEDEYPQEIFDKEYPQEMISCGIHKRYLIRIPQEMRDEYPQKIFDKEDHKR